MEIQSKSKRSLVFSNEDNHRLASRRITDVKEEDPKWQTSDTLPLLISNTTSAKEAQMREEDIKK